jgi:hypothetical protein
MSEVLHIPSTTARLDAAWRQAPDHLKPVLAAVRDCGVGFLFIPQGPEPFRIPKGTKRPAVYLIGDDFDSSVGPGGFHLPSLRRAMRECVAFAVLGGEATESIYAAVTAGAVAGGRVMIVETRLQHEIAWVRLIQKLAPRRMLIWGTVKAGRA